MKRTEGKEMKEIITQINTIWKCMWVKNIFRNAMWKADKGKG